MEMQKKALIALSFGIVAALAQDPAQELNSPPPPQSGWRKFGESRPTDLRPSQSQSPVQPQAPAQLMLPAGSWITVRVNEPLSSDHNQPGDAFTATLVQPLIANGLVVARRGQTVGGRVAEAVKA